EVAETHQASLRATDSATTGLHPHQSCVMSTRATFPIPGFAGARRSRAIDPSRGILLRPAVGGSPARRFCLGGVPGALPRCEQSAPLPWERERSEGTPLAPPAAPALVSRLGGTSAAPCGS